MWSSPVSLPDAIPVEKEKNYVRRRFRLGGRTLVRWWEEGPSKRNTEGRRDAEGPDPGRRPPCLLRVLRASVFPETFVPASLPVKQKKILGHGSSGFARNMGRRRRGAWPEVWSGRSAGKGFTWRRRDGEKTEGVGALSSWVGGVGEMAGPFRDPPDEGRRGEREPIDFNQLPALPRTSWCQTSSPAAMMMAMPRKDQALGISCQISRPSRVE